MSATEAALVTGYTGSRISVLRGDPAFEELISFYQREKGLSTLDLTDKMTALAADTVVELQERLELSPESFAIGELHDQLKIVADRTGHGPQSKTTNLNLNVNLGDRMKAARERAALQAPTARNGAGEVSHEVASAPTIIEGTFHEIKR